MNITTELNYMLLGRWMDTEFEPKVLANVSVETFRLLKEQILDIFEDCMLTDTDIKAAWKEWFDWAARNGCLVSPFLTVQTADNQHKELDVIDLVIKLSSEAIDVLPTEDNKPAVPAE